MSSQPTETEDPWPIIKPHARAAWDELQRELAGGYEADAELVAAWFTEAWERTHDQPAWWEAETPAPVADEPEPAPDVSSVNLPTQPMADEDVPQKAAAGPEPAPEATSVMPAVEALTEAFPAAKDGEPQ